jgi:hypothetical protein
MDEIKLLSILGKAPMIVVIFIIGVIFVLLGLSGGLIIGPNSFLINENWAKISAIVIGLVLIILALTPLLKEFRQIKFIENPTSTKSLKEMKKEAVKTILRAASLAILYPKTIETVHIRAFYHEADKVKKVLRPLCYWDPHHADDYNALIPYEGPGSEHFIISEAYNRKRIVGKNLPENHINLYSPELRDKIRPNIKCIFAAPISDFESNDSEVLGTLCFGITNATIEELGFDSDLAYDMIELFAKSIYFIMKF